MYSKYLFSACAVAGLAACGGGTTSTGATFDDVLSDFRSSPVLTEVESDTGTPTTFNDLITAGSASYSGTSLLYLQDDFATGSGEVSFEEIDDLPTPSLAGSVSLNTSFGEGQGFITGSFNDFIDRDGNPKSGALTLSNGELGDFFGTAALAANFGGTLSGSGLGSRTYEGDLFGLFTPEGDIVGLGSESLEDDINDDASFALVFVAED